MMKFIIGVVVGLALATVGFSGLARILDNGVHKVQDTAKQAAQ